MLLLLLLSLLTEWTVEISRAGQAGVFGFQSPVAWTLVVLVAVAVMLPPSRSSEAAVVAAAAILAGWVLEISRALLTPRFQRLPFPFTPADLFGTGPYLVMIALMVTGFGLAADRAHQDDSPARPSLALWPLLPGLGLRRLGYPGRGWSWALAAAFGVVMFVAAGTDPLEFAYYASTGPGVPPPRPRLGVLLSVIVLGLVFLGSWLDTWRAVRDEKNESAAGHRLLKADRPG